MNKNERREVRPDAQGFDEIRIFTVPRYKTSGLSGDEWRISAKIEFFRKGMLAHEEYMGSVDAACKFLYSLYATALDNGKGYYGGIDDFCDQEGCKEKASVKMLLKQNYCNKGEPHEIKYDKPYRLFCERHSKRGDCGLEDADANYEVIEGTVIEPKLEDKKESIFGGIISLEPKGQE